MLLGKVALNSILGSSYSITTARGMWMEKKGIIYMPTYHPAALLRDNSKKMDFWQDLKQVKQKYDELNNAQ